MTYMCRMCGSNSSAGELITRLDTPINHVSLKILFEMFTHVKFDDNPDLPQGVCESCRLTLLKFIAYTRRVEDNQVALRKIREIKPEDDACGNVIQNGFVANNNDYTCDEKLDSPLSIEDSSSSNSCNAGKFRNKSVEKRKTIDDYNLEPCIVMVEKLPLVYVTSDSGSESDDERSNKKPIFNSPSPQKRMRFGITSPADKTSEPTPPPIRPFNFSLFKKEAKDKPVTIVITPETLQYQQIFVEELVESVDDSKWNLKVPESAKELGQDGKVLGEYKENFSSWNEIKVKCPVNNCSVKSDPYQMKLHLEEKHKVHNGTFTCLDIGCSPDKYSFVAFCQHVIETHCQYLSYSCVMCSTMFFNYASLYRHYQSSHHEFTGFRQCLRDGYFFESLEKLERHFKVHKKINPRGSYNNNELSKTQSATASVNMIPSLSCGVCTKSFDTPFDLDWHMMGHSSPQKFTE